MGITDFTSDLMRGIGVGDPVIRLGVTGLSRAGKTVFITSLVANLMDRGRMTALRAAADGSIKAAWLQPQPDDTVPRFDMAPAISRNCGCPSACSRAESWAAGASRRRCIWTSSTTPASGFWTCA